MVPNSTVTFACQQIVCRGLPDSPPDIPGRPEGRLGMETVGPMLSALRYMLPDTGNKMRNVCMWAPTILMGCAHGDESRNVRS
jgi:hypothetical protein